MKPGPAPKPPIERFWSKVNKTETCWLWTASLSSAYGQFWNGQREQPAHRFSYEHHVGPIPAGYQIDHLCRVTRCVNPEHLQAVTPFENTMRSNSTFAAHHAGRDCGYPKCRMCRVRHRGPEPRETPDWIKQSPLWIEQEAIHAERRALREWADSLKAGA